MDSKHVRVKDHEWQSAYCIEEYDADASIVWHLLYEIDSQKEKLGATILTVGWSD